MCHIYQEKYGNLTSGYWIKCSSDHFFISQYLKSYDYLQIKENLVSFSLYATFLAVIFFSIETSDTHLPKTAGVF